MTIEREAKDPEVIRIIGIADPHLSIHNPPSWKAGYWETTLNTIDQVVRHGEKVGADVILWAGDLFHLKTPARNPLNFIAQVLRLLKKIEEKGMENWGIGGNHDLKFGSLKGLKGQPLDIIVEAGRLHLLDHQDLRIKTKDQSVRIVGESYHHSRAEGLRDKKRNGDNHLLAVGHFWFGPNTGEFYGEPMYGPDWLEKGEPDTYLIGHHHADQGVIQRNGKTYVAVGAISRTGAHQHDLERRPAASLIEIRKEGVKVTILRPNVPIIEEVIDLEKRKQVIQERKEMEEFIQSLNEVETVSSDPLDILNEMDLSQEIKERTLFYLQEAEKE